MYSITRFGDFPQKIPSEKMKDKDELFLGWMLLSYKKPIWASSTKDTLTAKNANDENPRSFWVANQNKKGESLTMDLGKESEINAVQINLTDYKSDVFNSFDTTVYTQYKILVSKDNKNWEAVVDLSNEKKDRPCGYFELKKGVRARYIRYEHIYQKARNLAISDFRVFGKSNDKMPSKVTGLKVVRQKDSRNCDISWNKQGNTTGYNIRWGIAKDKLYQTYQFWNDTKPDLFELRALNKGVKYAFAIEAFNEAGVSELSEVIEID